MLFGKKKPEGKTVLLLDVEQGSVGAALVRLEEEKMPRLFGEHREYLRTPATRDSLSLMRELGTLAKTAVGKAAQVATRLRNGPTPAARDAGIVSEAKIFLAAPWGRPDLAGEPLFVEPMAELLRHGLAGALGGVPVSMHTAAGGALAGARQLLPYNESYILCNVGGEVTELLAVSGGTTAAYATAPLGRHTVLRTLRTHGGMTDQEARSILRIGHGASHDASEAAAHHYSEGFVQAASELLPHAPASAVYVLAHDRAGEWFARALSQSSEVSRLFPQGGVVRALQARRLTSLLAPRAAEPDLMLGLQALFTAETLKW